jgi:hypothetical protein
MTELTDEELSRYARAISQRRRKDVPGNCAVCGKPFVGYAKKKFCSHACAQRDHYARSKARAESETREEQP